MFCFCTGASWLNALTLPPLRHGLLHVLHSLLHFFVSHLSLLSQSHLSQNSSSITWRSETKANLQTELPKNANMPWCWAVLWSHSRTKLALHDTSIHLSTDAFYTTSKKPWITISTQNAAQWLFSLPLSPSITVVERASSYGKQNRWKHAAFVSQCLQCLSSWSPPRLETLSGQCFASARGWMQKSQHA